MNSPSIPSSSSCLSSECTGTGDAHYFTSEGYNDFLCLIYKKTHVTDDGSASANIVDTSVFKPFNSNVNH